MANKNRKASASKMRVISSTASSPCSHPSISDLCGALGFSKRPSKVERIAWEGREAGSWAALRSHVERFSYGAYRAAASDMLAARRVTQSEIWQCSQAAKGVVCCFDGESVCMLEERRTQEFDARWLA